MSKTEGQTTQSRGLSRNHHMAAYISQQADADDPKSIYDAITKFEGMTPDEQQSVANPSDFEGED